MKKILVVLCLMFTSMSSAFAVIIPVGETFQLYSDSGVFSPTFDTPESYTPNGNLKITSWTSGLNDIFGGGSDQFDAYASMSELSYIGDISTLDSFYTTTEGSLDKIADLMIDISLVIYDIDIDLDFERVSALFEGVLAVNGLDYNVFFGTNVGENGRMTPEITVMDYIGPSAVAASPIPEPGTLGLFATACCLVGFTANKRKKIAV